MNLLMTAVPLTCLAVGFLPAAVRGQSVILGPFRPAPALTLYVVADGAPCTARQSVRRGGRREGDRLTLRVVNPEERLTAWQYMEPGQMADTFASGDDETWGIPDTIIEPGDLPADGEVTLAEVLQLRGSGVQILDDTGQQVFPDAVAGAGTAAASAGGGWAQFAGSDGAGLITERPNPVDIHRRQMALLTRPGDSPRVLDVLRVRAGARHDRFWQVPSERPPRMPGVGKAVPAANWAECQGRKPNYDRLAGSPPFVTQRARVLKLDPADPCMFEQDFQFHHHLLENTPVDSCLGYDEAYQKLAWR